MNDFVGTKRRGSGCRPSGGWPTRWSGLRTRGRGTNPRKERPMSRIYKSARDAAEREGLDDEELSAIEGSARTAP